MTAPRTMAAALAAVLVVAGMIGTAGMSGLAQSPPALRWTALTTGVTARLRGVSAVSKDVAWASGASGTVLRTVDGGASWARLTVPDSAALDFRDVDAIDRDTAYVLSIGPGDASRIYFTADGGATWAPQFRNDDAKAFFDAMAIDRSRRGYALSDAVDGRLVLLHTSDGTRWSRVPADTLPAALEGEGAFAASGSNVALLGGNVWLATASRVIRSGDNGRTWSAVATPLATGASSGIFSIAFRNARSGIVVGGDYKREREGGDNAAVTDDGGATWKLVKGLPGLRSAVVFLPGRDRSAIAVGPAGSDISDDGGLTWRAIEGPGFHAASAAAGSRAVWAVGENGTAAKLSY